MIEWDFFQWAWCCGPNTILVLSDLHDHLPATRNRQPLPTRAESKSPRLGKGNLGSMKT